MTPFEKPGTKRMDKTRLALVGAGVIGKRHLAAIRTCPEIELVALCDPFPGAAETASIHDVPLHKDIDDMLRTEAPHGVIVATPTEHHLEPASKALEAGAHVLVEKPITATLQEADRLIQLSASRGRHVLVGHQRRYYDCVHQARTIVQGGQLGKLVGLCGQWTTRKADEYYTPDWRKRQAAGPVLTNLIHEIDCLRYICGEITSVSGTTSNAVQGFEKEDVAALVLEFANGAIGTFFLSDQAISPWTWEFATGENAACPKTGQNATRFMGTQAALEFPNLVLWRHETDQKDWTQPFVSEPLTQSIGDAYHAQMSHFGAVIRGECEPRIDAADAAKSLNATVAIFEASETGRKVVL